MCGLTGWVDHRGNLTSSVATISAMTATMANRGPDDEGIWVSEHALLGHRRLSVIDLAGGRQPMAARDGTGAEIVISYTGEVYNFIELREELRGLGHAFGTESDTEVVLRAYLQWGSTFPERLNGIFAFALWDNRTEELLLVRDRFGVKPLYYQPLNGGVVFGSEPKAILAHPDIEAVIDLNGLREFFTMTKTPELAPFRGMFEVRPGTVVKVGADGIEKIVYWQLAAREHTDDLDTTIGHVRELLEDIVRRQLIADVPICSLLSGGLDSSAITALAAKVLAERGAPALRTYSVDFAGHSQRFTANAAWKDPDTPYAVEVAEHLGVDHVIVELDNAELVDPAVQTAVLDAFDLPVIISDMEYSLYLLCREIRTAATVALSGEAADELFGGYNQFHDPDAVAADAFPWFTSASKSGGIAALHSLGLWERLGLDEHLKQRYTEAVAECPVLPGESGHEARMREITYLHLTRWENMLLDRKDRVSMAVGLEVRVPFTDHRLVEYVFNTPWSMKTFDGHEKSLLRAAVADLLPESVAERRKTPYPSTQDVAYERALRRQVEQLLEPGSPVLKLVCESNIRELLAAPPGALCVGGPWSARIVLERLVAFNRIVGEHDIAVTLD
ncbi:asparagine synthase (glutamine-hydrolyzing) [Nocardia sp. NPDC005366]|uniref:asparagine synthase (glutamine-hydrolyzing) n=1 Tax=Nocardia sp. NPDC005366 TaxID=3156878 RepID=UPI0033ACBAA7